MTGRSVQAHACRWHIKHIKHIKHFKHFKHIKR